TGDREPRPAVGAAEDSPEPIVILSRGPTARQIRTTNLGHHGAVPLLEDLVVASGELRSLTSRQGDLQGLSPRSFAQTGLKTLDRLSLGDRGGRGASGPGSGSPPGSDREAGGGDGRHDRGSTVDVRCLAGRAPEPPRGDRRRFARSPRGGIG